MPSADHPTFDQLMPHTITVEHVSARDEYGKVTAYGSPSSYRALVLDVDVSSRTDRGVAVNTMTKAYINTDGAYMTPEDRVTMPNELGGNVRRISQLRHWIDGTDGAVHSVEVTFA